MWFRKHVNDVKTDQPGADAASQASGGSVGVEAQTQRIGRQLLEAANAPKRRTLSARFWSDRLMDWAMKDPGFKVQLFRFVDVLPVLKTPAEIHQHLVEYLTQPGVQAPAGMDLGLKAGGMFKGALAATVTRQIQAMAERFIAGRDPRNALPVLDELRQQGLACSVDLLGEACVSDEEARMYQERYLELIAQLAEHAAKWPANPVLDADHLGPIPRANVSIKISALYAHTSALDFEGSLRGLTEALLPVLRKAQERGVFINFDMENYALKDLTIALFKRCCEAVDFPAGLALQAYLRSAEADAQGLIDWAKGAGRVVTVRLVKGAYHDYEQVYAGWMGWEPPVWLHKEETDACFERVCEQIVRATPVEAKAGGVKLAVGSHNARSIAHALACVRARGLPDAAVEVQMLHGMAEPLKAAVVEMGLRLREYVPLGEMLPGMAYLVRRLLENTSNESWLRAGFHEDATVEALLRPPEASPESQKSAEMQAQLGMNGEFRNEAFRDFARAELRADFARVLERVEPPVGANDGTVDGAQDAVGTAQGAFAAWRDLGVEARAELLMKLAQRMRERRDELSALIIREAGKTWVEADVEVCEAIDFCAYYARQSVELMKPVRLGDLRGEENVQGQEPQGVAAVIGPWNFPLSIPCGMAAAALVTGNTVVLKPAEQTPGIMKVWCEMAWEAGVPREVLHFLAGKGETVGAALVRDPRVALIAFTGSKAVGMDIIAAAGMTPETQPHVKRVVCEMGGKNAIIVDASADLDEAVLAVRQSAFSYAGQKCSACSRVVVMESVHDLFLRRLVEATRTLRVGDHLDPGTDIGPVIDAEAAKKIRSYIEIARQEGKEELALTVPAELVQRVGRDFVGPHIFSQIRPEHRVAQEEIFGPVLVVMKARNFADALAIANGTPYKLTGGVFSRTPSHLELARREFRVGNLYLNRGITGAMVHRQPFGGFGWSGVGSKAGGTDYLRQFVHPRVCTENTLRRGFAEDTT